jgi:HAD superfamily hydrolase (TIGR01490 family)
VSAATPLPGDALGGTPANAPKHAPSTPRQASSAPRQAPSAPRQAPGATEDGPGGVPRNATDGGPAGNVVSTGRQAAFFDLDKTVIARSSTLAFSRPFLDHGLITRRAMLRSAYAHFFYQASGADHDQMERMRQYLSQLCAGWDAAQVREIVAETLTELITPLVFHEATTLIAEHHAQGRDVVIVSASGAEVVEPIGELLGADRVVATRMVVRDGHYTGEIAFYAYGENKAVAIRELAEQHGYHLPDCYAYSDSATDLPMLAAVGHPSAVNPDKALRREAQARGWPVIDFSHPVTLRSRLPVGGQRPSPSSAQTVAAVALGAGAAGLVWLAARRREHPVT